MNNRIPFSLGESDRFAFHLTQPLRIEDPWSIVMAAGLGLMLAGFIALVLLMKDD